MHGRPKYQTPTVQTPVAYKETKDWKVATPQHAAAREKWWEIYNDPQLNTLEDQVNVSNQTIAAAACELPRSARPRERGQIPIFPHRLHCPCHHQ